MTRRIGRNSRRDRRGPGAPSTSALTGALTGALSLLPGGALGGPDDTLKFHFFCGTDFADIQSDTCAQRQWCPSSSDDECLIPGHTCFANTPCDARLIPDIQVPTFSLSQHPEYRDATDKMFCGSDYTDAVTTCEAGDDTAKSMHCPDGKCPEGKTCFIEMPCSYFVMTNPLANPLADVGEMEVAIEGLPDPDSDEAHYFCGLDALVAESGCSSATWCRSGTDQECPNGESCFAWIESCEINAIVKKEYEAAVASGEDYAFEGVTVTQGSGSGTGDKNTPSVAASPTDKPTNPPLSPTDPLNMNFCGFDYQDASSNCYLERFCPNGDSDCAMEGMKCWEYTTCNAADLTATPTVRPTVPPSGNPTPAPIHTTPTQTPTTSKPSREPTPNPTGTPTTKPTGAPSKKPTHSPLPFGDFRLEFWCGNDWFDAEAKCSLRCPSGSDDECPGDLKCMSGVASCKYEMGLEAYDEEKGGKATATNSTTDGAESESNTTSTVAAAAGDGNSTTTGTDGTEAAGGSSNSTTFATSTAADITTTVISVSTENVITTVASGNLVSGELVTTTKPPGTTTAAASSDATTSTASTPTFTVSGTTTTTPPLQGPYHEDIVRIILYGIPLLDTPALDQWTVLTQSYLQQFFNDYSADDGGDAIRASAYDVTVEITNVLQEAAPEHEFNPLSAGEVAKSIDGRRFLESNDRFDVDIVGKDKKLVVSKHPHPHLRTRKHTDQNTIRSLQLDNATAVDNEPNMTAPMLMITYEQTITFRTSLDILNEDDPSRYISRRPLETPEYRAEYVSYLRAADFPTFGNLEFASNFLFTEFPTAAPTEVPTPVPTDAPVVPGQPTMPPNTPYPTTLRPTTAAPTDYPTTNLVCNLCRPGQYGINANILWNGEVSTCVEIYNWFLMNHMENSGTCRLGQEKLSEVCCRDPEDPEPESSEEPVAELNLNDEEELETDGLEEEKNTTTTATTTIAATTTAAKAITTTAAPEMTLPEVSTLSETYYCGVDWDTVSSNCDTATPCPSGDANECSDGEQCIAFTNCGGMFNFMSNPNVEGGGPDVESVKKTFYCGTSWQFLENVCDGATPCPNGPDDCTGEEEGCFAFTGCNEEVDPGSFVGFLKAPGEEALDTSANDLLDSAALPEEQDTLPEVTMLADTYYCGVDWDTVSSNCDTATPCPSGDAKECSDGEQCIAFTNCGGKFNFMSDPNVEGGGPDVESVKKTFYCGTSWQFLENICDGATPCPNGPNDCTGEEEGCFAFTGCNEEVDPGSFVGFLKAPDEELESSGLLDLASQTFYCAPTWEELDQMCVNGSPEGATPCPSGDVSKCPDGNGCFAYACGVGLNNIPVASPTTGEYTVEDAELVKATFFCGTSTEDINGNCETAKPCPNGDECDEGTGCFAFTQCGGVDIDLLTDSFGKTDMPTRAPTVPVVQVCDESRRMSVSFGYWQSWSVYRDEDCQRMSNTNFDANGYTHIIYSFASVSAENRLEAWNGTYDAEVPFYKEFNTVKQRVPGIKTMIAVGGWTHNDPGPMQKRFSNMASSKKSRQTFAQSVVSFLRTYGFDGLDIDWEYPAIKDRGGKRDDYDNLVLLTKEIRDAFNNAPENFELSVAMTLNTDYLSRGFDLAGMEPYVDYFGLMAYDLWGSWEVSELTGSHTDIRLIDDAVQYIAHFVQKDKLVLGLGAYARTFNLTDPECLDLNCSFSGPGYSGCEGTDGFLPYFEIADLITTGDYDTVRYDEETMSMVMVTGDGTRLISYDNTVSFNKKTDYAQENCMAGTMVWAIDMLKDGSNPLSSNNGNTGSTNDSFCGKDYQDVINTCKQPCPSGDSDECPPGEFCFVNSGCSMDNIGAPPPTKCRLCPDPSTQGMKDWLEIEYEGESITCSEADMTIVGEFPKDSEQCDSAKASVGSECCFNYPEDPCMLCRTETQFMDLRALGEIEFDGESMTCMDLSKRLGPEERTSEMCLNAQSEFWDQCCYNQCTLCEGQGVKWWHEIEFQDEPLNCGELDSLLYANSTAEEEEMCAEVLSEHGSDCCYDYPDDPCDLCSKDGKKYTLLPAAEAEYDGAELACAEINNLMAPFEASSKQCSAAQDSAFDSCCFDRCSLCGEGARLDFDVMIEVDGETGTCGDVEAGLFQDEVTNGNENCTMARSLHYDSCCFKIPETPCQLCAQDEYMHFTTEVEFNDDTVTCRSVNNFLMERADVSSDQCSDARATLGETCCYSTCNMCGEFDLDWDVFINYEGEDMSCGDLNEIFRSEEIVDGSEQCAEITNTYYDTCCYVSPTTSCQLCKHDGIFYDLNEKVQVDFNGPTTCYEVANFVSRRLEESEQMCTVLQNSLFDECCYEKCNLAHQEGTYPDWTAEVELDGEKATCFDLDNAIKDAAIAKDSAECQSLQDAFTPTCSFSIPSNPCDVCPGQDVSFNGTAMYMDKEMTCSDIKSRLSTREEADGEACLAAQQEVNSCCFDQCHICEDGEETDAELEVYYNGKTMKCTDVDNAFNENSVFADSEQCSTAKEDFRDTCCYTAPATPCNLCKRGTDYFDLMGINYVSFMDKTQTCADVSNMMFKREEQGSEACTTVHDEYFETCCNTKCSLCGEGGLEAGLKVNYEGRSMTCLELDLGLLIEAGSEACESVASQFADQCCYEKPETPCRICNGEGVGVNTEASVMYLGTNTTCDSLSNYLGSREEQNGETCKAAATDHYDTCCYERCSLCEDGKADWETFVQYEGKSIACGDFEWILRGQNVAADSDKCSAVKEEFYEKCCYTAPSTSCNLCYVDGQYLEVSVDAQVTYLEEPKSCGSLYNSLFMREASDSEQCNAAKDELADTCCFEKCQLCQGGFMDTTAKVMVNGQEVSCQVLENSFSKDVIVAGTDQCNTVRQDYADACCYTLPDSPCRLCGSGSEVAAGETVDFYGTTMSCTDVANKLSMSEESGGEMCSSVQADFATSCCFATCPICPSGFNLRWEVDVEYNKATISCGEFDGIIKGNGVMKGTVDCLSLQSTYSSACCYNYATSSYAPGSSPSTGGSPSNDGTYASYSSGTGQVDVESANLVASAAVSSPCNLCQPGEVGINAEILFNGVETSCSEVYHFLAIQTSEGSETCTMGKNALHDACCLKKCDLCAGGGIPDWYAMVNVNGNSMTCLQLDGIITDSMIEADSDQCNDVLSVAAPACCYVPPEEPCNICKSDSEMNDVMTSVEVTYGGTTSTCGAIFNALFSREEQESETCAMVTNDLAEQCCYDKCSLCGPLQTNAAVSVDHDGTQLGCGEFDSYIFSSNFIVEGSEECVAFQTDYKDECCYDIACNLCAKGDTIYTAKEEEPVTYGGEQTTCGQVTNFLTQSMSQSNNCLAAQENIFDTCCFQQCELCDPGHSINWASSTSFNGMTQTCTDVYWMLISESVESKDPVCNSVRDVARDCCYKIPSQQCTLCRDENGVTYNTRWNTEVTVNGVSKTCGDFNTLLSTQEGDSTTCSTAKEQIFDACCFAGSDAIITAANQAVTSSDASSTGEKCNLCQPGQVGINADITFNGNPTKCIDVYNFLVSEVPGGSPICDKSIEDHADSCCREPGELKEGESAAFGTFDTLTENEETASVPDGPKITPPVDFQGWTTIRSGSTSMRHESVYITTAFISIGIFLISCL